MIAVVAGDAIIAVLPVKLVDQGIDWPAWIAAAAALLTVGVLGATARYAYKSALGGLEDARRSRHAQLIVALDQYWESTAIATSMKLYGKYTDKALADLVTKMFGPGDDRPTDQELSDYESLAASANLIEMIGVLCDEGAITEDVVYKIWGGSIVTVWRAWGEALPKLREDLDEADVFVHFARTGKAMEARLPEAKKASAARDSQAGEGAGSGTNEQSSASSV
jgi:hypothetical protein